MRRSGLIWVLVGLVVLGALAWGALRRPGSGLVREASEVAAEATPGTEPARVVPANAAQVQLSFAPVARRTSPAVVNIYTAQVVRSPMAGLYGRLRGGQGRVASSLGSGVIVDASGLVVTNNHVVGEADEILVQLADRRQFPARVQFADPRTDLAVLKIDAGRAKLPVLPLSDSDRVQVGDIVLAIGNPLGIGQTVTQGIVSATARSATDISDSAFFLQTDAAINPGNSGGALVDLAGRLVGINTAIYSQSGGSEGIGFAIPSNMVRAFLRSARTGRIERAYVGIAGEPVTADLADDLGLDRPVGVVVRDVNPRSPAAEAGIRAGDVIFAVNGQEVNDPQTLRYRISTQPLGGSANVTVIRGGEPRNLSVPLRAPPENPPRDLTRIGRGLLAGVTVANLSPALALELGGAVPDRGVVVMDAARGADRPRAAR
jgi:serine protease Do